MQSVLNPDRSLDKNEINRHHWQIFRRRCRNVYCWQVRRHRRRCRRGYACLLCHCRCHCRHHCVDVSWLSARRLLHRHCLSCPRLVVHFYLAPTLDCQHLHNELCIMHFTHHSKIIHSVLTLVVGQQKGHPACRKLHTTNSLTFFTTDLHPSLTQSSLLKKQTNKSRKKATQ